jgi:hypothetical protein
VTGTAVTGTAVTGTAVTGTAVTGTAAAGVDERFAASRALFESTLGFLDRAQTASLYYIRRSSYPLIGWLVDHVWATTSPTITWWAGRRIFVC